MEATQKDRENIEALVNELVDKVASYVENSGIEIHVHIMPQGSYAVLTGAIREGKALVRVDSNFIHAREVK